MFMQILICDKSFLNYCKSVFNALLCLKKLSIVCQIPDVFALTRLANFFQKHLKKCFIVVLTEDALYMACNIQLII